MMKKFRTRNALSNIVAVEKVLNSLNYNRESQLLKVRTPSLEPHECCSEGQLDNIGALLLEMQNRVKDPKSRPDINFVEKRMIALGYVKKGVNPDYARFQEDAMLSQSVWSRYYTGSDVRTSHDTFLKIVIGLKLNLELEEQYLSLAGDGLRITDKIDQIILAIIVLDYLGETEIEEIIALVQDILDFYSEEEVKKGRKPFRKLYNI